MSEQIIAAIIGAFGGGVFTFIITYFTLRKQKKRMEIEHHYSSMPLLMFNPNKEQSIKVSVDKSVLTGDEKTKGEYEEIDNAFGFSIRLKNVGNETANETTTIISLEENVKIIEYSIRTILLKKEDVNAYVDKNNSNKLIVEIPYLNETDSIYISLIATGIKKSDFCKIEVTGKGIKSVRHGRFKAFIPYIISSIISIIGVFILSSPKMLVLIFSEDFLITLGLKTKTVQEFEFPCLHNIVLLIFSVSLLIWIITKAKKRFSVDSHKPWIDNEESETN